jgi:hypothetical protein
MVWEDDMWDRRAERLTWLVSWRARLGGPGRLLRWQSATATRRVACVQRLLGVCFWSNSVKECMNSI